MLCAAIMTGLIAIDWQQTRAIAADPVKFEINPILGKTPSNRRIDLYFASAAVANLFIYNAIPNPHQACRCLAVSIAESAYIANNYAIGVRVSL